MPILADDIVQSSSFACLYEEARSPANCIRIHTEYVTRMILFTKRDLCDIYIIIIIRCRQCQGNYRSSVAYRDNLSLF